MDDVVRLLLDSSSVEGKLATSAALLLVAVLLAVAAGWLVALRFKDSYARYYGRKIARAVVVVVFLIALAILWRPFAGRIGVVLGLAAAGFALAMQEVIGALAGWISILTGRQYRVGDRIQIGRVRGDVFDITPLRTKVLEIGSTQEGTSWVHGRQFTGRVVSISNKAVFSEPVFNSTAVLDYLWEELTIPVDHRQDWRRAEQILQEETERASSSAAARRAIGHTRARYPVADAEARPRVFVRVTNEWVELTARFVVPVRDARVVKDQLSRNVLDRLSGAGIEISPRTQDVTVRVDEPR